MKRQLYIFCFLLMILCIGKTLKAQNYSGVEPPQTTINLEPIVGWLCPQNVVVGDREFDGHGPKIKCEVKLRISGDKTSLWADISFWAQETQYNWSETSGNWSKKVYDAPYGKKIGYIAPEYMGSRGTYISQPAGFQLIIPGRDATTAMKTFFDGSIIAEAVLIAHGIPAAGTIDPFTRSLLINKLVLTYTSRGNTVMQVPPIEGKLVNFFHIVGDTGGADISTDTDCNDDTRIEKIEFLPIKVTLVNG